MRKRRFVNILAMLGGVAFAIYGVLILTIAATGNVIEGRAALACGGAGLLLVAAPLLAVPFSARVAKAFEHLAGSARSDRGSGICGVGCRPHLSGTPPQTPGSSAVTSLGAKPASEG